MPPRPVAPGQQPQRQGTGTPQPGGGLAAQLNPAQLAALQEYIQSHRRTTGQEVTGQMIQEWMILNRVQIGQGQQGGGGGMDQQQQQAQLLAQQRQQQLQQQQQQQQFAQQQQQQHPGQQQAPVQPNEQALITHLFPPQLAANQGAAVGHLQNILFPAGAQPNSQSPLLQQVMHLASNQRLTNEQMAQLKLAVSLRSQNQNAQNQQFAQQQAQQQQQQLAQQQAQQQQQQQQMAAQQAQQQQQQQLQQGGAPTGQSTQQQNASQAVQALQQRVHHIEALLSRPDATEEQRIKMQAELDAAKTNLQRVIKLLLAAHNQNGGGQQQGGPGGGPNMSMASLQEAQRAAMEKRARELQMSQAAGGGQPGAPAGGQYRTASPSGYQQPGGLALPPGAPPLRQSPSAGAGLALPGGALSPPPLDPKSLGNGKKLTKKQQLEGQQQQAQAQQQQQQYQQQAAAQALAHQNALAHAQQQAAAAAAAAAAQQQGGGGGGAAPYLPLGGGATLPIPANLSIPPPSAEAFPAPRPTLSSGLANSPSLSTPSIVRHPGLTAGAVAEALGRGEASSLLGMRGEDGRVLRDLRPDSEGRTVRKRKLRELVEAVGEDERLDDSVEDLLLEVADEFIDSITRMGCQLAKHRKSDRLEVRDIALHLDRSYGIRVPGFSTSDAGESRQAQTRRVQVPPGHAGRLAAIREAGKRR